ncbi:MAG: alpha/beta hydrolase [Actinomycetota bacterium]
MVNLSDNVDLLAALGQLPFPRLFVHGEQNRHLSYLGDLPGRGVEVAEIPWSGHFPMYANPAELWLVIARFIESAEESSAS